MHNTKMICSRFVGKQIVQLNNEQLKEYETKFRMAMKDIADS